MAAMEISSRPHGQRLDRRHGLHAGWLRAVPFDEWQQRVLDKATKEAAFRVVVATERAATADRARIRRREERAARKARAKRFEAVPADDPLLA
jgi:hypothetical protein